MYGAITMPLWISPGLYYNRRAAGWEFVADTALAEVAGLIAPPFELVPVLGCGERRIGFEEVIERSQRLGALSGQHHAEAIFLRNFVPPLEGRTIVFPTTVWKDQDGVHFIPAISSVLRSDADGDPEMAYELWFRPIAGWFTGRDCFIRSLVH